MPRKSELDVQGRRPAENPQQPRGDFLRGAARWRVGAPYPTPPVIFPSHRRHGRNRRAITVVRSLTSLVALAALAPTGAAPASAQPIDLLGSPTVTAPPNNAALSDTHAATALPLLGPSLTADEPRRTFLEAARRALEAGRIEEAREALERAETRLLNAPAAPVQASSPERQDAIRAIGEARRALAAHDRQGAIRAIYDALAAATLGARVTTPSPPPVAPTQPAPDQPSVTYALLPGHWQLQGAQYVWVPPEIDPRPVAYWRFVQGRYVWRGGNWVWAPAHYE
jgi:hypothetical protein